MKTLKSIYSFLCKPIFSYFIFWGWNFTFLILLLNCLGILVSTIENVITGYTPLSFSICVLFFLLIPVASIFLGFTVLKNDPKKLLKFFYGIELPLWMLFLLKFSLFRELTVGSSHIFLVLFLGLIGYAIELFSLISKLPTWYKYVHKLLVSCLLFIGVYVFLTGIFYSFPIIVNFLIEFFSFNWVSSLMHINFLAFFLIGILFFIFIIVTVPLVVFLPIFIVLLYTKSFIHNFNTVRIKKLKYLSVFLFALNFLAFLFLNNSQSHQIAFDIANKDMSVLKNRAELHKNEEIVKKGLLNAYLNKYRYISSTNNNHIEKLYKDSFRNDFIAINAQHAYNFLMSPFLFKGDRDNDIKKAQELYESNFDIGIQKDNKNKVVKALKTTWDADGAEAGVLNVNQERVLLTHQDITIKEHEGTANIEIHEIYKNVTFDRQEIFYYFTIPPNTVINGLWLSDSDIQPKKYAFKVSPRGAAQQVYKEEVRKRVDPSLLEQVGPFQYRLRAFPILPKRKNYRGRSNGLTSDGDNFHLWISFKTILSSQNDWKMPQLLEKRNVYWNENSVRTLNGEKLTTKNWLPKSIQPKKNIVRNQFTETLNDSVAISVTEKTFDTENYLEDKRISFIIDGSYSMKNHLDDLKKTLHYFSEQHISTQSELNFIHRKSTTNTEFSRLQDIKKEDFYGTISNIEVLHNFKKQNKNQDYIIYITDEGSYDETVDSLTSVDFSVPLIVVHLNDAITPIYADAFLESVQNSKGFIVENSKNINTKLHVNIDPNLISYQDGYAYEKVHLTEKETDLIKDITAYEYINNAKNNTAKKIDWLDEIHSIAVENKIVTKFSSMIVLVNDIQKKRLEELENKKDRFDREKEDGKEELTNPSDLFSVKATPEPEEWLLIGLILLYIGYHYYYKRTRIKI